MRLAWSWLHCFLTVPDLNNRMVCLVADSKFCVAYAIFIFNLLLTTDGWAQPHVRVDVGSFSQNDISGWEIRVFAGATSYQLTLVDGKQVLAADSRQSGSMFYKKIRVDLEQTPILNWSWRKEHEIDPGNELDQKGDDYVARIYVVKSERLIWWKTIALNYVWSYQHKRKDVWDNPFAGRNSKMLAQRDASDPTGVWFTERRNVAMDFKRLFGKDIRQIDGVAIMTDSDNSGLNARALYGDIFFDAALE
jgi:hypothetical protein